MSSSTAPKTANGHATPRKGSSRQKSCLSCVHSKTRCDLERPTCGKCREKRLECVYTVEDTRPSHARSTQAAPTPHTLLNSSASSTPSPLSPSPPPQHNTFHPSNLANDDLASGPQLTAAEFDQPPNTTQIHDEIGSRWLDTLLSTPGKIPKVLSNMTGQYTMRILQSYVAVVLLEPSTISGYDALPPFIHPATGNPRFLANCRSLLRMWDRRAVGSEGFVRDIIARQMNTIVEDFRAGKYDQRDLLSACQAYLIYAIHLCFCADEESAALVDATTIINMQELAGAIARAGLFTSSNNTSMEMWVNAETRRRTVYTMYLLDNAYSFAKGTLSYVATELGRLPAPAPKSLWTARTQAAWEVENRRYETEWQELGAPVCQDMWPHDDPAVVAERRARVDRWIAVADEFGMFMFATVTMQYSA